MGQIKKQNPVARVLGIREVPLLLFITAAVIALAIAEPRFMLFGNIHSILLGGSYESIIAIGMTLLFVMGGFDLSVGSVAGFAGVILKLCFKAEIDIWLSIAIALSLSAAIGLVNGLIISYLKVNSLITTLSMQMIVRGLIYVFTKGIATADFPQQFTILGRATFLNIQVPIYICLVLAVIFSMQYKKSAWFRQFYFIGGGEEAARLSGIKVDQLKVFAYVFTAILAGLAGVLLGARMGGAIPTQGEGIEMNIIAGCVIGGCSVNGGEGSVFGSVMGVMLMALILNAFNLVGIDIYWQKAIKGSILLFAVLMDILRQRRILNRQFA